MKKRFNSLSIQIPIVVNIFIAVLLIVSISTLVHMSKTAIDKASYDGFATTIKGYSTFFDSLVENQLILADTYSSFTFVINYMRNRNAEAENNMLTVLKIMGAKNPYVKSLSLIEANGTILNNSEGNNADVGKKVSDLYPDLWRRYDAVKKPTLSDSIYKDNNGKWITAIIAPVKSRTDNTYLGGIMIILDWQKVIDEISITAGEVLTHWIRLWVFNKDTLLVMHNVPSEVGKLAPVEIKTIVNNTEGKLEFQNDGMTKVCLYNSLKDQPWKVGFSMPLSFIEQQSSRILLIGIIIGIVGIILSSIIGFLYIKNLISPLKVLVEEAEEMSRGQFVLRKFKFKRNEIGDIAYSFKNMRDAMVKIINEVNQTSEKINNAASSLAQGSDDLSARTDAQASSLEETASAIEEMASTIKSSADHSVEGNDMMIASKKAVENGASVITETTRNIEEVYESSEKIKSITKTIEDIAFQTNILALNASVEAARAGDQGRGFAVVASEVRNLAQNSQSSAKDITLLIENIYEKINKSAETARESQAIFNDIQSKIDGTAKIMQEISTTAVEQQTGVDQVNIAVSKIDGITQQNAALVDETTNYARELLEQSENLKSIMTFFKMD
ncbi:methyl-accepting chemotaxis protein [Brachyspira hyodysenteriae]|uniref:Chemotaxis protein n=21 Tax=Brachyspira TaxID=29521 RepID=A0A3B6W118_BRAHO|nr:methyl-accepting chemotaxis protein [Brachyspira hyodysenteriae]ANN63520.1 chemotaxis protein [Brachyspira hyodysenteriae ATCC 27164]KLI35649.1 chemotaxis protein [Brachyspira hyodysenteriae]KLI51225.1 chemotaxis protein [Brachyspira hyodysenteriae]KLI60748.1 chemotaxis protein [Brachyspira hyodysenteriae]MCZ9886913.1 methyl-accepting chemotaxis protein [Brachyspira hyodysenteriae]